MVVGKYSNKIPAPFIPPNLVTPNILPLIVLVSEACGLAPSGADWKSNFLAIVLLAVS